MARGISYLAILVLGIAIGWMRLRKQQSQRLLEEQNPSDADWQCPDCAASVPGDFDTCWNCGTTQKADADQKTHSQKSS